ncbi:MAG: XdhC family protein [Candidatus Aminicenantes bacterium]|nr:XdhC family protein [Candidatus Aminicenantes bacterium]
MEHAINIYREIIPLLGQGRPLALATIVAAEGATPQKPGASALFDDKGLLQGTLGGGMMEADAQERAYGCLKEGRSLFYRFDLRGDDVGAGEPVCGGSVRVLIDGSPSGHRKAWLGLEEAIRSRRSGLLVTRIHRGGAGSVEVERFWLDEDAASELKGNESPDLPAGKIAEARRKKEPVFVRDVPISTGREGSLFLEPLFPLPRLLIVGAGHVGRAVARLGSRLDFEVTVIDDRPEFVSPERLPGAASLVAGEIDRTTRSFPVGSDTYIVIVTRGHSHDAEALRAFIRSPAAYVGMIGSRKKIALMRERFVSEGWATASEWDRIHTPIGLQIGSRTVEEIAVSIAAELIQVRSRARESIQGEGR